MTLKLLHRNVELGEITEVTEEFPWVSGQFAAFPAAQGFKASFDFMTDEDRATEDPPFSDDLLSDENWFVMDQRGEVQGISMPAVHPDGEICWRRR
jgi:hypothetical protein